MIKDFMKELKGIMVDVIEQADDKMIYAENKHRRAAIVFDKYDEKIRNPEINEKLTDGQRKRLQSIYENATKELKAIIEEVDQTPEKKAEKPKFKVGQRVQFKTWKEMEKEFGIGVCGSIKCECSFLAEMKPLCGTYATITGIKGKRITLDDFSSDADHLWNFSVDMVKAVE